MEENNNTSLFRSVLNTFEEVSKSFLGRNKSKTKNGSGDDLDDTEPKINVSKVDFLRIKYNTRCLKIIFLPDKFDTLMDIISNEMRLKRVDFKHGALFKSQNGSNVTVTVYKSTNSIHVQGTAYFGWAKSFVEQVKAKAENILSYDEGDVTCQVPQMTSTPIRREVTLPADDNQCHHDDDCGDDFETMDSSMFALAEEIDLLRKRIKDLESKQGIRVSKCDSATQTDPLHIGDVGADIDP